MLLSTKKRTFILSLVLLLLLSFFPTVNTYADESASEATESITENTTESIYVQDGADVLSDNAETNLRTRAEKLFNDSNIQIAIVTVPTLNGQNIETYTANLMKTMNLGGEEGRGLILLLDIEEDIYVTISGDALKGKFTSEVLQTLLNEKLEPRFMISQYEDGVNAFFTEAYYMAEEFNLELEEEAAIKAEQELIAEAERKEQATKTFWSTLITILLILVFLVVAFFVAVYVRGQIVRKKRREAARRRRAMERRTQRSRRDYL